MKNVESYHNVPHKIPCDCLSCALLRRVQSDAYGEGHQDGYYKGAQSKETPWKDANDYQGGATHPSEVKRIREHW